MYSCMNIYIPGRPAKARRVFALGRVTPPTYNQTESRDEVESPTLVSSKATNTNPPPWGIGFASVPLQLSPYCLTAFEPFNRGIEICPKIWHRWHSERSWNASTLAAHKTRRGLPPFLRVAAGLSPWPPNRCFGAYLAAFWLQRIVFESFSTKL